MTLSQPEHEHALQDSNNHNLPKGFFVDQGTGERLAELCCEMTDSCGLITAILQLALEKENENRTTFINTALDLSSRAIRSLKMFLSEWHVLTEASEAENARRAALVLDNEVVSLAEAERRTIMNAIKQTKGNHLVASRLLGIGRTTLYRKLQEYGMDSSGSDPAIAGGEFLRPVVVSPSPGNSV
jgi:hypothetical protein